MGKNKSMATIYIFQYFLNPTMTMKKLLLTGLIAIPLIALAGGAGNSQDLDLYERAKKALTEKSTQATPLTEVDSSSFESSEAPKSILESRKISGSINQNYIKYSFDLIPSTYWNNQAPAILDEVNGFIELEEYFGQTERENFEDEADLERENERQQRAQAKALRLRSLYR